MIRRKNYYTWQRKAEAASVDKLGRTYAIMLHWVTGYEPATEILVYRGAVVAVVEPGTLLISISTSYPLALRAAR